MLLRSERYDWAVSPALLHLSSILRPKSMKLVSRSSSHSLIVHTEHRGRPKCSESASAVNAFPTSGGPLFELVRSKNQGVMRSHNRSILTPHPFSSKTWLNALVVAPDRPSLFDELKRFWARTIITSFFLMSIIEEAKGWSDQWMSRISSTAYSPR